MIISLTLHEEDIIVKINMIRIKLRVIKINKKPNTSSTYGNLIKKFYLWTHMSPLCYAEACPRSCIHYKTFSVEANFIYLNLKDLLKIL